MPAAQPPKDPPEFRIGFISGTPTHNRDFALAAEAISSIMEKYPQVSLMVVGWLDLPESFSRFENRVVRRPYMDYLELLKFSGIMYAIIVPLEYTTAFCNAKSELKYFEQALVGVPVIASPTVPYQACITDGVNGLLAADTRQWAVALERLIGDRSFRDRLATNARNQIRETYYPDKIGKTANDIYRQIVKSGVPKTKEDK